MTSRITVVLVLPSGAESGYFSVHIVEDGHFLEHTLKWPAPLVDLEVMHKKRLTDWMCREHEISMR